MRVSIFVIGRPFSGAVFWARNGQITAEMAVSPAPGFAVALQEFARGPDGSIGAKLSEARDRRTYKRHRGMQSRLQNSACAGS